MNSLKRVEEDTTVEIPSLLDPSTSARVIRSHRRPADYSIRPTSRRIVIALIIVSVGGSPAILMEAAPTVSADAVVVAPVVEPLEDAPEYSSQPLTAVSDTSPVPVISASVPKSRKAKAPSRRKSSVASRKADRRPPSRTETVIRYALAQRGDRYRWGSAGPNTYDCSGLVLRSFKQVGINLPHYTGSLLKKGKRVSYSQLKRGDLVFPSKGHVGIYLGNGKMVHASSGKGRVIVAEVYAFYAARRIT